MASTSYGVDTSGTAPQRYPSYPSHSKSGVVVPQYMRTPPPQRAQGGGRGYNNNSDNRDWGDKDFLIYSGFSDTEIRHNFIKKVYLILMAQFLVITGFVCLFFYCKPVKEWLWSNSWFYWMSYATFCFVYFILLIIPSWRRKFPADVICLSIFTLCLSYMAATITSYFNTPVALYAVGITCSVCACVSLFAMQTGLEFNLCIGLLYSLLTLMITFGFSVAITFICTGYYNFGIYLLYSFYGLMIALLMTIFLIINTLLVLGGENRKYALRPDEYAFGSLQIYLDFVYFFLTLCGLMDHK